MRSKVTLSDVVLDYITRYGLTEMARQYFISGPDPNAACPSVRARVRDRCLQPRDAASDPPEQETWREWMSRQISTAIGLFGAGTDR